MDLWIRSNDGVLFEKAEMIKVSNIQDKGCNGTLTNFRYGIVVNNDYVFAEYKSKKRALEVLDEIERLLIKCSSYEKSKLCLKDGYDDLYIPYEINTKVYQMPKE